MGLTRWEPLEELSPIRDAINRLFEEGVVRPMRYGLLGSSFPVDVYETETEYVIEAPLAGVKLGDIQVSAVRDVLTIHATIRSAEKPETPTAATQKPGYYVRRERYSGEMIRTLELPSEIDAEKVIATYENGMLTVRVPKIEAITPKQIPVNVKDSATAH